MNVLFAGDTHGNLPHLIYLMQHAKQNDCDRIFVLGDFGAWEHTAKGVQFMDKLNRVAEANDLPVYWLRGNHDKVAHTRAAYSEHDEEGFLVVRSFVKFADDGLRWTWDGVTFLAFGGAYSVDKTERLIWEQQDRQAEMRKNRYRKEAGLPPKLEKEFTSGRYWFPEEEATDEDVCRILEADSSPVNVLLTHDKPRSSNPNWNRKAFLACLPNQDRVTLIANTVQPHLNLHGHLHYFYRDKVLVGLPGQEPKGMIVIGLDADCEVVQNSWLACDLGDIREKVSPL